MGYLDDLRFVLNDVKPMMQKLRKEYNKDINPKTQLIDKFIVYCVIIFLASLAYRVVAPKAPLNALLAAVFVSLGGATLAMSLRVQLTDEQFKEESKTKAFVHFVIVGALL